METSGSRLPPHPPRVQPGPRRARGVVRLCARPAVLAGHLGQLALARELGLAVAADVYLNAANRSALEALESSGARVSPSASSSMPRRPRAFPGGAPGHRQVEVVAGGEVFSMLTRAAVRHRARASHGSGERARARRQVRGGRVGDDDPLRGPGAVGARAPPALAGKVDSIRLDLAHQSRRGCSRDRGRVPAAALGSPPRSTPAPRPARSAVEAAAEIDVRHAPAGSFRATDPELRSQDDG